MGGSQGARSINLAAIDAFAEREGRDFDVIHLAGRRDFEELRARLGAAAHPERYTLLAYEPDLGDCPRRLRPGPGSLGRIDLRGRRRRLAPAILVPYPHATADHQSANAAWMERRRRRARDR